MRQQDAFFARGVEYLRPLNLKTIADAIGMHESTVSRVTSNKYMATPRGLFELKYFFTASIASHKGGDAHSAEAVRFRIKQMIDQEDASRDPLRRCDRRAAQIVQYRYRPPHGRQISGKPAHSFFGRTPPHESHALISTINYLLCAKRPASALLSRKLVIFP